MRNQSTKSQMIAVFLGLSVILYGLWLLHPGLNCIGFGLVLLWIARHLK